MKKLILAIALVLPPTTLLADLIPPPPGCNQIAGSYIVVFPPAKPASEPPGTTALNLTLVYGGTIRHVYEAALRGYNARNLESFAAANMAKDERVAYIEHDCRVTGNGVQLNPWWGLDRIDQRDLPLDGRYTYSTAASNVHVYVIDSGMRKTHNEFGGRAQHGYDFVDDDSDASDCHGHGTHVAGIAGGSTYGVAKAVRLHAVRVLDCVGFGTYGDVIAGVNWVKSNHVAPAVANLSLGGPPSNSLDQAVSSLVSRGVTVVVAAGNNTGNACGQSPSRVGEALTVAATTRWDTQASFSNWGPCVDIYAPGDDILSAWRSSDSDSRSGSGTSQAAPHAAGVAALYLADHPGASPATVMSAILGDATAGRLSNLGSGSPNLLLYSPLDGAGFHELTVSLAGSGSGTVTSSPAGIDCGTTCQADFDEGEVVTLTAVADPESSFAGWSGDCSGMNPNFTVTMNDDKSCTATFSDGCTVLQFEPTDDTNVREAQPDRNFGTGPHLWVRPNDSHLTRWSYLKFDVVGIGICPPVQSAKLWLHSAAVNDFNIKVDHLQNFSWTETTLTWNNKQNDILWQAPPQMVPVGEWIAVDVTGRVTANGVVTFKLRQTFIDEKRKVHSKESAFAPYLELTF